MVFLFCAYKIIAAKQIIPSDTVPCPPIRGLNPSKGSENRREDLVKHLNHRSENSTNRNLEQILYLTLHAHDSRHRYRQ